MAALDDALNEASVVYGPHQLKALWRESDLASDGSVNVDTPTDLTPQFTGQMTIEHSLDDGLPDPVTMTSGADASGILSAGLNGREGLTLASSGQRSYDGAGGSWDSGAATKTITAPIPTGTIRDDFVLAAVIINDNTATLAQATLDAKDNWDFLGVITDAPLAMYVYGKRRWRTGHPQLNLISDKNVNFMSLSISFWARNPMDMALDYRVTDIQLAAESASVTSHNVSSTLKDRGFQVGFWGSATIGGITPTAPMVLHGDPALNGLIVMGAIRPLSDSGVYTANATQSPANAIMCMASVSVEPYARPKMDARQYFSPFNRDSPVYAWDRDTADVLASIRVLTSTGPVDTLLFDGQMQGISIQGRQAIMNAVSKARIWLNRSITLPMVTANRENMTLDWLATYLMARGGSFVGPAPSRYTRYWAPLYGSVHAHWDTPKSYNAGYLRHSDSPMLLFGLRPPSVVPSGKWLSAMYAQQTATRNEEVLLFPRNMYEMGIEDFPHLWDNGQGGPFMFDMQSLANNRGRIQFWVRADAAQSAPTYMAAGDDFLVKFRMSLFKSGVGHMVVEAGIASNSRNPYLLMGNDAGGYTSVSFVHTPLPTDGSWNFYGIHWDYAAGSGNAVCNGTVLTSTTWLTNGNNVTATLPATDAIGRGEGFSTNFSIKFHIPASDVIVDYGQVYSAGQWNSHYPTPQAPGANAVMRPTNIPLNAIAEASAVNAWDTLAEVARNALAAYRCNENDFVEFLPQSYFGEVAQMTSVAVQDTTKNASDMDVDIDPSKTRNVVTVQFPDTRVDSQVQPLLLYLTSTPIPKGVANITFPLDVPVVEIHGQATFTGAWDIVNLTSSQITTPTLPKTSHYITVATGADGGGSVLPASSVSAKIVDWDAMSIKLQFTNTSGAVAYLANNGDQVPFLQILGYGVRASEAYTTARDAYSVTVRRERGLETQMYWNQSRAVAEETARQLTNILSRPMAEVTVTVVGDPRRKPGQLVTLLDKDGTQVSGTWRILSVGHHTDGAAYVQDLKLKLVGGVGVWDATTTYWDSSVWGV